MAKEFGLAVVVSGIWKLWRAGLVVGNPGTEVVGNLGNPGLKIGGCCWESGKPGIKSKWSGWESGKSGNESR